MILYAAGNFVLMSDPEKEKKFIQELAKRGYDTNRLISFFFKKELNTILQVNGETNENK
jgi:hypothetical protein